MTKADFISRSRDEVTKIVAALDALRGLRRAYDALDLGNSTADADFDGANKGLTKTQLVSAFQTVQAIETLISANGNAHATNLLRITR